MVAPLTVKVEVNDVLKDVAKALQMIVEEMRIMDARIQVLESLVCKK